MTAVRTYPARLEGIDADVALSHHVAVNLGKRVLSDVLLTARAGVEPVAGDLGRFAHATLWTWWFSAEEVRRRGPDDRPTGLDGVISVDPAADFAHELALAGVGDGEVSPILTEVAPLVSLELRAGTAIINRRAMWRRLVEGEPAFVAEGAFDDLVGRLLDVSGCFSAPPDLGADPELPTPRVRSAKAQRLARKWRDVLHHPSATMSASNWVGQRFGTGRGSDFDHLVSLYRRLGTIAPRDYDAHAWQDVLVRAGAQGTGDELLQSLRPDNPKQSGAVKAVIASVGKGMRAAEVETLAATCAAQAALWAKNRTGTASKGSRAYATAIKERLCRETGLPDDLPNAGMVEMLADVAQALQAHCTATRTRLAEVLGLADATATGKATATETVARALDAYCKALSERRGTEVRAVGRAAARGLRRVVASWDGTASAEERKAATRRLVASSDEALGDTELFDTLAERWTPELRVEEVDACIALRRDEERLRTMSVGRFVHPDPVHHPRPTTFGPGYWGARVRSETGPWRVRMKLFDGTELVRGDAVIASRRLYADIASAQGAPRAARADHLGRAAGRAADPEQAAAAGGRVEVALTRAPSFRLMPDRRELERDGTCRRWTALVAVRLEPQGPGLAFMEAHGVARPELVHVPGLRVMGTNLGMRAACGWSLWETASLDEVVRVVGRAPAPEDEHVSSRQRGAARVDWRRIGPNDSPVSFARLLDEGVIGYEDAGDRQPTWIEQALVGKLLRRLGAGAVAGRSVDRLAQNTMKAVQRELRRHGDLARAAHCLSRPTADATSAVAAMAAWWRGAAQQPVGTLGCLWCDLARPLVEDAPPEGAAARWWGRLGKPAFPIPTTGQLGAAWRALRQDALAQRGLVERWEADDVWLREALRSVSLLAIGGALSSELALAADGGRRGSLSRFCERAPRTPTLAGVGGGRSLRRVELLDHVRRLRVSYATRTSPDGTRAPLPEGFGRGLGEKRRNLVDDIAKQTASAIVLTALHHRAHVVVAEDLSSLSQGGQDPAATRRLRSWRRARVADHLKELCELHGLVLATTNPAYSSWRDARDNAMGIAAEPVAAAQLRRKSSWTRTRLEAEITDAAQLGAEADAGERARLLGAAFLDLSAHLEEVLEAAGEGYVVVPRRVGRWFAPTGVRLAMMLSTDDMVAGRVPPGLRDADANAAGNTAIRWLWGRVAHR